MKQVSTKTADKKGVESVFRRARGSVRITEDEALNAICDARLKEPRKPLDTLLKKL